MDKLLETIYLRVRIQELVEGSILGREEAISAKEKNQDSQVQKSDYKTGREENRSVNLSIRGTF